MPQVRRDDFYLATFVPSAPCCFHKRHDGARWVASDHQSGLRRQPIRLNAVRDDLLLLAQIIPLFHAPNVETSTAFDPD